VDDRPSAAQKNALTIKKRHVLRMKQVYVIQKSKFLSVNTVH
jgi:hypothetical protein